MSFAPTIEDGGEFWVAKMAGPDGQECQARMAKAMFTHAEAACTMMLAVQQEFEKHRTRLSGQVVEEGDARKKAYLAESQRRVRDKVQPEA